MSRKLKAEIGLCSALFRVILMGLALLKFLLLVSVVELWVFGNSITVPCRHTLWVCAILSHHLSIFNLHANRELNNFSRVALG